MRKKESEILFCWRIQKFELAVPLYVHAPDHGMKRNLVGVSYIH